MTDIVPNGSELVLTRKDDCPVCQHPVMRQFDEEIWGRRLARDYLVEKYIGVPGIIFTRHELDKHSGHLKLVTVGKEKSIADRLKEEGVLASKNTDDVEAIDAVIVRIRRELNKMGEQDSVVSGSFVTLSRLMSDLIEKKNRLTGKISDSTNVSVNIMESLKDKLEKVEKE